MPWERWTPWAPGKMSVSMQKTSLKLFLFYCYVLIHGIIWFCIVPFHFFESRACYHKKGNYSFYNHWKNYFPWFISTLSNDSFAEYHASLENGWCQFVFMVLKIVCTISFGLSFLTIVFTVVIAIMEMTHYDGLQSTQCLYNAVNFLHILTIGTP